MATDSLNREFFDMALQSDFKISDNIGQTDEGYLICYRVPVARTGIQEYLGSEIGLEERPNDVIKVMREPEEVFNRASMSSGEGKAVTNDHPPVMVNTQNHNLYCCGHAQNVRRSGDFLMMDLVIVDDDLIEKIKNGKREVSLGYHCQWLEVDNGYKQTNIRINHVAIVDRARAGRKAAIRDSVKKSDRRFRVMNKAELKAALIKSFVADGASAAELNEAISYLNALDGEGPKDPTPVPAKDDAAEMSLLKRLLGGAVKDSKSTEQENAEIIRLQQGQIDEMKKTIDELMNAGKEKEIGDEEEEPSGKEIGDEDEEEESYDEEHEESYDEEEEEKTAKDTYAEVKRMLNPALKKLSAKDRTSVKKALAPLYGRTADKAKSYGNIRKGATDAAKSKAVKVDDTEIGDKIAAAHNPHYKNRPKSIFS